MGSRLAPGIVSWSGCRHVGLATDRLAPDVSLRRRACRMIEACRTRPAGALSMRYRTRALDRIKKNELGGRHESGPSCIFGHAGRHHRCPASRIRGSGRHEVGFLFGRRPGTDPLRGRPRCRDADEARRGEDGWRDPVRVAAPVAQISLRHREQRRPGRNRWQRALPRRLRDRAERRSHAAWRGRQAQVPADPFERRQRGRICPGRLQLPVRDHRAPDQG